jgi:hypothetical protein
MKFERANRTQSQMIQMIACGHCKLASTSIQILVLTMGNSHWWCPRKRLHDSRPQLGSRFYSTFRLDIQFVRQPRRS